MMERNLLKAIIELLIKKNCPYTCKFLHQILNKDVLFPTNPCNKHFIHMPIYASKIKRPVPRKAISFQSYSCDTKIWERNRMKNLSSTNDNTMKVQTPVRKSKPNSRSSNKISLRCRYKRVFKLPPPSRNTLKRNFHPSNKLKTQSEQLQSYLSTSTNKNACNIISITNLNNKTSGKMKKRFISNNIRNIEKKCIYNLPVKLPSSFNPTRKTVMKQTINKYFQKNENVDIPGPSSKSQMQNKSETGEISNKNNNYCLNEDNTEMDAAKINEDINKNIISQEDSNVELQDANIKKQNSNFQIKDVENSNLPSTSKSNSVKNIIAAENNSSEALSAQNIYEKVKNIVLPTVHNKIKFPRKRFSKHALALEQKIKRTIVKYNIYPEKLTKTKTNKIEVANKKCKSISKENIIETAEKETDVSKTEAKRNIPNFKNFADASLYFSNPDNLKKLTPFQLSLFNSIIHYRNCIRLHRKELARQHMKLHNTKEKLQALQNKNSNSRSNN